MCVKGIVWVHAAPQHRTEGTIPPAYRASLLRGHRLVYCSTMLLDNVLGQLLAFC